MMLKIRRGNTVVAEVCSFFGAADWLNQNAIRGERYDILNASGLPIEYFMSGERTPRDWDSAKVNEPKFHGTPGWGG